VVQAFISDLHNTQPLKPSGWVMISVF